MLEFKQRRAKFLKSLGKSSIAILVAAKQAKRNADYEYPYRQNSDFYYLTGFCEPEALAVFIPGRAEGEFILFNRPADPLTATWTGALAGQKSAIKKYGANQSFPITTAPTMLLDLMTNKKQLYFGGAIDDRFMADLFSWCKNLNSKSRHGKNAPTEFITTDTILHEMRLRKSKAEIALLKKSAEIGAQAHIRAMRACKPGMFEHEIEAELMHEYIKSGARQLSFPPIVAGGANGCVLHYNENSARLNDGELVLIDAGVEHSYYGSDITRTFPINGRFTKEQAAIYQAVLNTQKTVIAALKPGVTWHDMHALSEKVITQELVALKILKGKNSELLKKSAHKPFYMHFVSHFMGLDDHDVGTYKTENGWRKLEKNMVMSVEPGIYINSKIPGVDKKWHNIAVRIEDYVVITKKGCEILSKAAPKEICDIEKLMANNI